MSSNRMLNKSSLAFVRSLVASVVLGFGCAQCTRLRAAVDTYYNLQVKESERREPQQIVPLQRIEIEANQLPLLIHFNSHSSKLQLSQSHKGNAAEVKRSNSEEEPDILEHVVKKPIIHQLKEVIMPYRKTIQEIKPVQEELKTIVSKESLSSADDELTAERTGDGNENEKTLTALHHSYLPPTEHSPSSLRMLAQMGFADKSTSSAEKAPELHHELFASASDETYGGEKSPAFSREKVDSVEDAGVEQMNAKVLKSQLRALSTGGYHFEPEFEKRANLKQYPLMQELQRIATGYMLANYAKQMKRQNKLNRPSKSNKHPKHHPKLHQSYQQLTHEDDMDFGDSKTVKKYKRWPRPKMTKRNSGEMIINDRMFDTRHKSRAKNRRQSQRMKNSKYLSTTQQRAMAKPNHSREKRPKQQVTKAKWHSN